MMSVASKDVRNFLGDPLPQVGAPHFEAGDVICNAKQNQTAADWAPRGWDITIGDRIQCESRNRVKDPNWRQIRFDNWDRNWCWIGVKEMCHENLKTPYSWNEYRELAFKRGYAPSPQVSPFHGLLNPELCDGAKHGIPKPYYPEEDRNGRTEKSVGKEEPNKTCIYVFSIVQVYVLNLPKFYNRWDVINKRLAALQIQATRVIGEPYAYTKASKAGWILPGFDMDRAQALAEEPANDMGRILGTVGCAAAHFKAQSQILYEKPRELPCDWDVLQLLGRCAYGMCVSEHVARIQPDANEPDNLCHAGVNWGFHGVLYRTEHLGRIQDMWKKRVFNPETPHCLAS
eukprot:g22333.t1